MSQKEFYEHKDFYIGLEFFYTDRQWRCTDVGSRVIMAVCLSEYPDDASWFNGPPYAVVEHVFDEDTFENESLEPIRG